VLSGNRGGGEGRKMAKSERIGRTCMRLNEEEAELTTHMHDP
jgi:hypothetical protein